MVKIMIVEDSNLMKSVIANFIKKKNNDFEIITADGGEQAVEMYKKENPDLVFMDIRMPGMDGITAMEKILGSYPKAKVVMCTALKETEQEERARKAGAVGYITKPFSSEDIIKALNDNLPK
ncbi:response regulator [Candidatus Woesearchaeota archaeon]|nr:response regulator [Candidatus Woesearchaeota archaeon]